MTAVAEHALGGPALLGRPPLLLPARSLRRALLLAGAFAIANAALFLIVRPGVNDLWAARARASAASHGVGLTYWFSWFGGASTPGNYSVLTPYLSALFTAELVGAVSAVAITWLTAVAVKGTAHPRAATAVATVAAGINLWSGRVPFLLGSALALAAVVAVRRRRTVLACLITALSILASPVSAAFLALILAGTFVAKPDYRRVSAATVATVAIGFGLVALAFGTPGPQHFSLLLVIESVASLVLFRLAEPDRQMRVVIWLALATTAAMVAIPNGLGSNFARLVWFCLPVFVVATSRRSVALVLVLVAPVVGAGAVLTVTDLRDASQPVAGSAYYQPLARELAQVSGLTDYRVEIVSQSAHAAYASLLDSAMLARGWETQEDNALNGELFEPSLDATSYKVWLDNNSVGYVAVPTSRAEKYPEYSLVAPGTLRYLTRVWTGTDWALYRVGDPTPIVAPPQSVLDYSQAKLTVHATCACTFSVRIRYSKYLRAQFATGQPQAPQAVLSTDGYGYTVMTTPAAGDYMIFGTVAGLFH